MLTQQIVQCQYLAVQRRVVANCRAAYQRVAGIRWHRNYFGEFNTRSARSPRDPPEIDGPNLFRGPVA